MLSQETGPTLTKKGREEFLSFPWKLSSNCDDDDMMFKEIVSVG